MKAVIKTKVGFDQMEYQDVPKPQPERDLVQIRVAYTGICGTDIHAFQGTYKASKPPLILGHEFSGIVSAVGPDVKRIKVGDRVTSETTFSTCGHCKACREKDYNLCSHRKGIGTVINGSMAEFVLSREESVHILPDQVSLLAASLTEPLACVVHACIEKADIKKGRLCCIFGAGAMGLLTMMVAKASDCQVVIAGISRDKERLELAALLGADKAINQEEVSISDTIDTLTDSEGADYVFECSGSAQALNKGFEVVKKKGKVIQIGIFPEEGVKIAADLLLHKEIQYIGSRTQKPSSWIKTIDLLAKGSVHPEKIITDVYDLSEWRKGFDHLIAGQGVKNILKCNEVD